MQIPENSEDEEDEEEKVDNYYKAKKKKMEAQKVAHAMGSFRKIESTSFPN